MLNVIRKQASSWFVKGLLLLLVVSFAIWGIGDVFFGSGQSGAVATVGDSEIQAQDVDAAFERALDNVQRQIGTPLDRAQAMQFGLMQRSLQELISQRLIDLEAHKLGLAVTDDTLRELITRNELFQTNGSFDRTKMEQLLRSNGLTEQAYLASLRQDVLRGMLTSSVAQPAKAPAFLADRLYRYRNERREGRYVTVEAADITDLPPAADADLQRLYDANQARFAVPDYRTITFVALTPDALVAELMPDEATIRKTYDERQAQYRTPERRTLAQLLAKDKATIDRAAGLVAGGKSFADVAKELASAGVTAEELGSVAKPDLPLGLGEAAFAPAVNVVSAPAESPFGWHLFRASEVVPETVTPFAQVQAELGRELALEQAHEQLPDRANQLDDELAAGVGIKAAAATAGVAVKTLPPVDRQGLDQAGKKPGDLPAWPEFLTTAFDAAPNQPSLLEETQDGHYFVLQVDQVTPKRQKTLAEVQPQVLDLWRAEQQDRRAREQAAALRQELAGGRSLGVVARDRKLVVQSLEPVTRTGDQGAEPVAPALVQALFRTEPGTLAAEPVQVEGGYALVQNDRVIPADPASDQAGLAALQAELDNGAQTDLLSQYQAALQVAYPVEIDPAALNRLMSTEEEAGGGPMPIQPSPQPQQPF